MATTNTGAEEMNNLPTTKRGKRGSDASGGRHQSPPSTTDDIRDRREALGLSRARLAEAADVSVSRVWAAEHPDAAVSPDDRERIVAVLNSYRAAIAKLDPLI